MSYFLVAAALLTAGTLLSLIGPLLARSRCAETRADNDAQLYRQQLSELERDVARGVIDIPESEGARAEIARRLIAATKRAETAPAGPAPDGTKELVLVLVALGLPLLAGAIYLAEGNPEIPGLPFAARGIEPSVAAAEGGGMPSRPTQAQAEALVRESGNAPAPTPVDPEYAALIERVERIVADRGGDAEGLTLLADAYMRMGRPSEAWRSYHRLIALRGSEAPAELHSRMAEAMIMAANGYISPRAERAIAAALKKDPAEPAARYYSGIMQAQAGRPAEAIAIWEALREDAPRDAAWAELLDATIAEAKAAMQAAGPSAPALTREQMQAAEDMAPEQRQAMIEGMVGSLEERLTTQGGEPEEWARLMTAYARLGRLEEARRAYELGRKAVGTRGGASFLYQQALVLGIVEG